MADKKMTSGTPEMTRCSEYMKKAYQPGKSTEDFWKMYIERGECELMH